MTLVLSRVNSLLRYRLAHSIRAGKAPDSGRTQAKREASRGEKQRISIVQTTEVCVPHLRD